MESSDTVISSGRLNLVLLTPEVLRLSLEGNTEAVQGLLEFSVPEDWYQQQTLIRLRLQQINNNPAYQPWSTRAIVLRDERQMVGTIGFHTPPGAAYLHPYAPDGVEFGYTVFPPFQRRGYAREACLALMGWAYDEHQVTEFVVTISPENTPSLRLAENLGFRKVGSHIDEEDGLEEIFRLDFR